MKKRGIIPDKLVQSRLEKFIQTYPNLKLRMGESSTNGDEAPVSSTNSNGGGGQKRKLVDSGEKCGGKIQRITLHNLISV